MKKKTYETPQMEVMNISLLSMMAISDFESNVFDGGYQGGKAEPGQANKRRNSWDNTGW